MLINIKKGKYSPCKVKEKEGVRSLICLIRSYDLSVDNPPI